MPRFPLCSFKKGECGQSRPRNEYKNIKRETSKTGSLPFCDLFEKDKSFIPTVFFPENLPQVTDFPTVSLRLGCSLFRGGESERFFCKFPVHWKKFVPFSIAIPTGDFPATAEDGESTDISAVSSGAFFHLHQLLYGDAEEGTA
jgi:hypothetical protein